MNVHQTENSRPVSCAAHIEEKKNSSSISYIYDVDLEGFWQRTWRRRTAR